MLITCIECGGSISDKAASCPHCGYPLKSESKIKPKTSKRARLPNGFGRITEIKNKKLRKPFRAMVTDGKDENGRPIGKLLKPDAYFKTYNEAYAALVEYNKNPFDLSKDITMNELYERWFNEYSKTVSASRIRTIKSAWSYCEPLHNMHLQEVRVRHLKNAILNASKNKNGIEVPASAVMKAKIKGVFITMYSYAIEYELIDRNYAKEFSLPKSITEEANEKEAIHQSFCSEEIASLWNNKDQSIARMILVHCYMGWRPSELCQIEIGKVDMKEWIIIGGMKTKAGKNRIVPVHTRIRDLVKEEYNFAMSLGSNYLFNYKAPTKKRYSPYSYDDYFHDFNRFLTQNDFSHHKPHDPRKHFITMAKKYGVDEYAIKLIVGHSITDVTESVYTERSTEWLHKEIAKIP